MIKISNRLLSIVDNVYPQDVIIDVGCDHAYLAIYLMEIHKYKRIYVSDINEKALQNGTNNIAASKLSTKIIPLLGDGLSVLHDESVNTLIISGLGAYTILDIIKHPNIIQINKIIIQSNTDHYLIRKSIINQGFKITNETAIKDNNKYYITIIFTRGKNKISNRQLKYGFHNNIDYYQYLRNRHIGINRKISFKHPFKKIQQIVTIFVINSIIIKRKLKHKH